jgi:hypothetical protein
MKFTKTERRWLKEYGIQRQHIYNWQRGGGISMKYLPLIAKVKGISADALLRELSKEEKDGTAVGVP